MTPELSQRSLDVNEPADGISSSRNIPVEEEFPNLCQARAMTDKRTAQEMITKKPPSPHPLPYLHSTSAAAVYKPTKSKKPCTKPVEPKG